MKDEATKSKGGESANQVRTFFSFEVFDYPLDNPIIYITNIFPPNNISYLDLIIIHNVRPVSLSVLF